MGSNRACSFGQTMINSGLDFNRAGWSCPDLGPAWPKERVLSSLYILDILFGFDIDISCDTHILWAYSYVLRVYCFDDVSIINKSYLNKTL